MTPAVDTRLRMAQRAYKYADLEAHRRLEWYRQEMRDASTIWAELGVEDWKAYVRTQMREAVMARKRARQWLRECEGEISV